MKVRISEASELLGVSITTLRRWDSEGILLAERTPSGHRRYDLAKLQRMTARRTPAAAADTRLTIGYARIASPRFSASLTDQVLILSDHFGQNNWHSEIIEDSGPLFDANGSKRGLHTLVKRICAGDIGRLVVTHRGHLLNFGSDLIFGLCETMGTEIVILNPTEMSPNVEFDSEKDVDEIVQFLLGRLSNVNIDRKKELIQTLQEVSKTL